MSNSNLVTYTKISPNKNSPRNHKIDTITIHCYVGQVTAQQGCNGSKFVNYNPTSGASCNYVIGYDGSIGLCVDEKDRSWCSSNSANDNRSITIEVASETTAPYKVTDKALNTLISLCADICKRNGIKKLVWSESKADRINHKNDCNMTVHRDFSNKSCPGEYLYNKHSYIASEVNKKLGYIQSTYTVQSGDTLSKIGEKTGIAWKTIADLNGLKSPYTITIGQVLKLTEGTSASSKFIFGGVDYSLVFDPTYYTNKYTDLRNAFGTNNAKLFEHFCDYGMKEGRQAISSFNVKAYKERYTDLQRAFGEDLTLYYKHWIEHGKNEGRIAV